MRVVRRIKPNNVPVKNPEKFNDNFSFKNIERLDEKGCITFAQEMLDSTVRDYERGLKYPDYCGLYVLEAREFIKSDFCELICQIASFDKSYLIKEIKRLESIYPPFKKKSNDCEYCGKMFMYEPNGDTVPKFCCKSCNNKWNKEHGVSTKKYIARRRTLKKVV